MRKTVLFFLAFSLMISSAAFAAPAVDAAGAAALKKRIDEDLQWRTDTAKIMGQGLVADGQSGVSPQGNAYEVFMPPLAVLFANQQGKMDISRVTMKIAPTAEPDVWLIQEVNLPPTMTIYDAKNAVAATIQFGKHRFNATWEPGKGLYSKVDSLLEGIKITGPDKNAPTINIAALKSLVNLKSNADGTWSGPADFGTAGITVISPGENPVSASIGKVTFRNFYDKLDMRPMLKKKGDAQQALKAHKPQTDQEKKAFLAKYLIQDSLNAQGVRGTFEVGKFSLHDTGTPKQQAREIKFDQLTISGETPNMKSEKNKILLKVAFQGLHISFIPPALAGLLPHKLNTEITLDNLPITQMTGKLIDMLKKQDTSGKMEKQAQEKAKAEASEAMAELPKMLQDAGATLSVDNTYAESAAISTSLQSKIQGDSKAALGVTGKVMIAIAGLDEFVQKMQEMALKPGSDPQLLGYLMGVMTLQTRGQPAKAANGTSVRNFAVEMKKSGDILLNGTVVNSKTAPPATRKP